MYTDVTTSLKRNLLIRKKHFPVFVSITNQAYNLSESLFRFMTPILSDFLNLFLQLTLELSFVNCGQWIDVKCLVDFYDSVSKHQKYSHPVAPIEFNHIELASNLHDLEIKLVKLVRIYITAFINLIYLT